MFRQTIISLFCAASATAAPELADASFLFKDPAAVLVHDTAAKTRIFGFFGPPVPAQGGPFTRQDDYNRAMVAALLSKPLPPHATLSIEWLNQNPPPADFQTSGTDGKVAASSLRMGTTHISRTFISTGDAIILHFIADKPGDISFRASLIPPDGKGETVVKDRRELVWSAPAKDGPLARVWVIPFESDVETEGNTLTLRGEGECLVIFNFAQRNSAQNPIENTWQRLIDTHDPGADPADPTKIWAAIRKKAGLPGS